MREIILFYKKIKWLNRVWIRIGSAVLTFFILATSGWTVQPATLSAPIREEIRGRMDQVLADPRFVYRDSFQWLTNIFKEIAHRFGTILEFFTRWFPKTPSSHLNYDTVKKWFYIGMAIAVPVFLVWVSRRLFTREYSTKIDDSATEILPIPPPDDLRRQAELLAAQGQYNEAVRYLYLACLESLKTQEILPESGKTSDKETLRILRRVFGVDNETYRNFSALMAIFHDKWYGMKPCLADDYFSSHRLTGVILEQLARRPHAEK